MRHLILSALVASATLLHACTRDPLVQQTTPRSSRDVAAPKPTAEPVGMSTALADVDYDSARTISTIDSTTDLVLVPVPQEWGTHYVLAVRHGERITASRRIKGAWIDNSEQEYDADFRFLDPPLFALRDVNGDGRAELLIKDRQHNGTWNAAYLHIYSIAPHELEYLGSFEYLLHVSSDNVFIRREWDFASNRVEAFITKTPRDRKGTPVGQFAIALGDSLRFNNEKAFGDWYDIFVLPEAGTVWQEDGW